MIVIMFKGVKRRNKKLRTVFQFPTEETQTVHERRKIKKINRNLSLIIHRGTHKSGNGDNFLQHCNTSAPYSTRIATTSSKVSWSAVSCCSLSYHYVVVFFLLEIIS